MPTSRQLPALLISGFLAPLSLTIASLLLPDFSQEYGLDLAASGLVPTLRSAGEFAGALASGVIVGRLGLWRTFLLGHGCMALGCLALFWPSTYVLFLALIFLTGLATAFIVTTMTTLAAGIDPERPGRHVGAAFASLAAGQVGWPLIMGWPLALGTSWRTITAGVGLVAALIWLVQGLVGSPPSKDEQTTQGPSMRQVFADRRLWRIGGIKMMWMASHMIMGVWLPTYVVEHLGHDAQMAGAALSMYMAGVLGSRLVMVRLTKDFRPVQLLLAGSFGAMAVGIGMLFAPSWELFMGAVFVVGLLNGAGVPLFLSHAGERFGSTSGVFGALMAIGLISVTVSPGIAGTVAQVYGLWTAFWMVPAALAITITWLVVSGETKPPQPESAESSSVAMR